MALGFVAASLQYLNSGWTPLFLTTSPLTICFWLKTTNGTNNFFYCGSNPVTGGERQLGLATAGVPAGSKVRIVVADGVGGTADETGTTVVNDGAWHHIAVVRDLTADKWYVYVDGALDINVADGCNASATLNAMFFACRNRNGSPASYISATLDDIIAGQFTTTQAQIQALANSKRRLAASVFGSNIVRWWPLQGINGAAASGAASVQDYSANLGHGTPSGSPLYALSPLSWPAKVHYAHAVAPPVSADFWNLVPEGASPFSPDALPSNVWGEIPAPTPAWA